MGLISDLIFFDDEDDGMNIESSASLADRIERVICDAMEQDLIEMLDRGEVEAAAAWCAEVADEIACGVRAGGGAVYPDPSFQMVLGEVEDILRGGETDEATHRLHLLMSPKWIGLAECEEAYVAAMGTATPPAPPPPWSGLPLFLDITP